jgi:hypothetical protein
MVNSYLKANGMTEAGGLNLERDECFDSLSNRYKRHAVNLLRGA